ncbi:MAG: fatty acid desaturase [Cyanobacteria bacterium P01_H01_bin.21]
MTDAHKQSTVSNQVLQETVADLQSVRFWPGFWRFSMLGTLVLSCITLAWTTEAEIGFWAWTVVAGMFYAFWLICTHDAIHHTLLGWPIIEETLARIISWPMLWPVGVYSELHRLHHGWNGLDLRDPERIQWTEKEYQEASPLVRWYMRHQWLLDVFILGGLGIVVKTLIGGRRFQELLPRLRFQLLADLLGMGIVQVCLITVVVLSQASVWRYLLFWLCLERVIGVIAQTRAHLEHYGLWRNVGGHQLTQLYSSRNLQAGHWFSWLIGGLNYHAVHHAFPGIQFDRLPEAYGRIETVLDEHGMPALEMADGYPSGVRQWINRYALIPN